MIRMASQRCNGRLTMLCVVIDVRRSVCGGVSYFTYEMLEQSVSELSNTHTHD